MKKLSNLDPCLSSGKKLAMSVIPLKNNNQNAVLYLIFLHVYNPYQTDNNNSVTHTGRYVLVLFYIGSPEPSIYFQQFFKLFDFYRKLKLAMVVVT